MALYGNGRAALVDDSATAARLGWARRSRSAVDPEILLTPIEGDPCREPWIARRRTAPGLGAATLWKRSKAAPTWTYLPQVPGVDRYLHRLAEPTAPRKAVVGITGLGRVGGLAAAGLAIQAMRHTGIGTLLIHDSDGANLERWRLELASIAIWGGMASLPIVEAVALPEMFRRSDMVLFAAASAVPPLGALGDMRLPQFPPNRAILGDTLAVAHREAFAGLFLMVSDPVECLAQAAFHDSNADAGGAFTGHGLAPERIAGMALGVMYGRALAAARDAGAPDPSATTLPLGPHSSEVLAFDDPCHPDPALSRVMTDAARSGNIRIRELGFLPYIGPALSSIVLTLPRLLAGRDVLTSPFVDGLYFGTPSRYDWGMVPRTTTLGPDAKAKVEAVYGLLAQRMARLGLVFP